MMYLTSKQSQRLNWVIRVINSCTTLKQYFGASRVKSRYLKSVYKYNSKNYIDISRRLDDIETIKLKNLS